MEVLVGLSRQIVVDGQVDSLDIDTSAENISRHTDSLLELLELLVSGNSLLLGDTRVHSSAGEAVSVEDLRQTVGSRGGLDENNHLVELEVVEQIAELSVLGLLVNVDKVLLQTVQSELSFVVNENLQRRGHELLADGSDLLRKSGGEHHDLLLSGSDSEDLLHVSSHINLVEHLVTLVNNESLDVAETEVLVSDEGMKSTGSGDNHVRRGLLVLDQLNVLLDGGSSVENGGLDVGQVLGESGVLVHDLVGQLSGVTENDNRALAGNGLELLESGQDEDGGFTHTGLGLAENVSAKDGLGDADLLDWVRRVLGQRPILCSEWRSHELSHHSTAWCNSSRLRLCKCRFSSSATT